MRFRLLLTIALITLLTSVSRAGDFTGTLTINGKTFPAPHVHVLLHDNAEGVLPFPTELRILVTDREVPIDALYGLTFLPVADMGRRGEVEGVLLRFDPAKPGEVDYTVLTLNGVQTFTTKISIKELRVVAGTVSGAFDFSDTSFASFPDYPKVTFSFRIDAPVKSPPAITADLKGTDALNSPQVKALRAIADAIATGDFEAMHKLTSESATVRNKEELARLGAGAKATYKSVGTDLKKRIPGIKRVVVRGDRAVVIVPGQGTVNFIFERGSWKGD
jgi:hypothetical protein